MRDTFMPKVSDSEGAIVMSYTRSVSHTQIIPYYSL